MTEWGLIAVFGIPTAMLLTCGLTVYWMSIKRESDVQRPQMHQHTIHFIAERERRMKRNA
ncbi:hypothetical protein ACFQ38_02330 [Sporosarcina contaminans]|uniref:Uncharacterized protein n=1 Tax=Sporosarcina contaminans TaxID=633403 RepID=A0ABW3TT81_9BACL